MAKYQYRAGPDGTVPCDCCGYKAPVADFTADTKRVMVLCEICASTPVGIAHEYPRAGNDSHILKTIAWIGNRIMHGEK